MRKSILFSSAAVLLFCTLTLFGQQGGPRGGGSPAGGRPSAAGERDGSNSVGTVELSRRSNYISVAGRLQPKSRIVHKASVTGYVSAVNISEGEYVNAGDHLFRIDRNDVGQSFKPVYVDARISGVISQIDVQINSDISAGTPGVTIVETDSYSVEALISDKDAFKISIGQSVSGQNPDGQMIEGTLTGRSQEPDYNTGLFSLTFNFPWENNFHIGSFILIRLPTDLTEGFFVGRDSLVRRYGRYFLWVVDPERKLTAREVSPGADFGDEVHIVSGLEPGERYLIKLTGKETEGMEIGRGTN